MNLKNKTDKDKFRYINRSTDILRKLQGGINDEPMGNNHFWDRNDIHQEIIRREKDNEEGLKY